MAVVVDASVALSLFLDDEKQDYGVDMLKLIREEVAYVPPIFWLEVANALLVNEKRRRITTSKTKQIFRDLCQLPLAVVSHDVDHELLDLARKEGLSIYDATYLQLALKKQADLLTLDNALAIAGDRIELGVIPA